jgi:hypothetical protein
MKRIMVLLTVLVVVATLFTGCAQSETPPLTPDQTTPETEPTPGLTTPGATPAPGPMEQPSIPGASTGTLTVLVTDAPGYEVTSVVVHFSEVWVHKAADEEGGKGGWIPVELYQADVHEDDTFDGSKEVTLSTTMGPVILAQSQVPAGRYTQIRVIMEEEGVLVDYTDENDGEHLDVLAKLPSGKLRFVRPFVVPPSTDDGEGEGERTEIELDFDLQKSVVFTGPPQSEDVKVIVKPVVKLQITIPEGEDNTGQLELRQKDPDGVDNEPGTDDDWSIVDDEAAAKGTLTYNLSGETFDFVFAGEGLDNISYSLIYYADYYEDDPEDRFTTWGGNHPGALIASDTADEFGALTLSGSVNLRPDLTEGETGIDLPWPPDGNIEDYDYSGPPDNYDHAHGAKIWLVPSECYDSTNFRIYEDKWQPDRFLFETDLITFDDIDNEYEPLE